VKVPKSGRKGPLHGVSRSEAPLGWQESAQATKKLVFCLYQKVLWQLCLVQEVYNDDEIIFFELVYLFDLFYLFINSYAAGIAYIWIAVGFFTPAFLSTDIKASGKLKCLNDSTGGIRSSPSIMILCLRQSLLTSSADRSKQ
jgi:hypothetical protein